MKDYYAILGIKPEASRREIKRAYRKLVRKWHPDLNPDDPACGIKVQEINEAYEVLRDRQKRQSYDRRIVEGKAAENRSVGFSPGHLDHPFLSYFLKMSDVQGGYLREVSSNGYID